MAFLGKGGMDQVTTSSCRAASGRGHGWFNPIPGSWRLLWLVCVVFELITASAVSAADPAISGGENEIKAAFLVNFPKYVEWPSGGAIAPTRPIVLALFGDSELEGEIRKAVERKVQGGQPLVLKRVNSEEECVNGCHIVFIAAAEQRRVPGLLNRLRDLSVLTVGESEGFLENGGIIKLIRRERVVRFQVNLTAARRARLEISSKLLNVADAVVGKSK